MAIPMPINVNMFALRNLIEAQARWKKGHPPHKTTGVANANWIQVIAPAGRAMAPGTAMCAIASATSGAVNAVLIQNRRVMSRNSGFSSVPAELAVTGSSAIPQVGHVPGSRRPISGCIGQVY